VSEAIERLQKSELPPAQRLDLVAALEGVTTTTTRASAAKEVCSRAYRALGEHAIAAASASAGLDPSSKIPPDDVIKAAGEAGKKNKIANEAMPKCLEARHDLLEYLAKGQ